jgi:hypothetical protein
MTTQESKRKLTAILSTDVKGYSRLMSQDEEATRVEYRTHCFGDGAVRRLAHDRKVGDAEREMKS